jgi:DNA-3-methyladenine glycosylase II
MTAPARLILDPALLASGLDALCAADPDVAAARARIGDPALRTRDPGFVTLLDVIVGQQLSTASAGAIRARVHALVQPLTPETYLATRPELLLKAGLSRQKLAYSRDLALASLDGRVDFDRLHGHEDEDAIEHLISIKGIGRWTAEIYLLFSLGRCDVWPAEDLALQVGLQHLKGLDERPRGKVMRALGEAWRPWRGVGAYFLWHVYHHLTRRVAVPIEPVPRGVPPPPQAAKRKPAPQAAKRKPSPQAAKRKPASKPAAKRKPAKKKRAAEPARRTAKPKAKPRRSATRARS